jgi:hypothetical protein
VGHLGPGRALQPMKWCSPCARTRTRSILGRTCRRGVPPQIDLIGVGESLSGRQAVPSQEGTGRARSPEERSSSRGSGARHFLVRDGLVQGGGLSQVWQPTRLEGDLCSAARRMPLRSHRMRRPARPKPASLPYRAPGSRGKRRAGGIASGPRCGLRLPTRSPSGRSSRASAPPGRCRRSLASCSRGEPWVWSPRVFPCRSTRKHPPDRRRISR